jgi:hypothetical protein
MVKHPDFKIIANDKDVTNSLRPYLISIEYSDDIDNEADGLTLRFQGENFKPPSFKDVLKIWLGYRDDLWYIGSFSVLKSRLEYETLEVEITATPIDFSGDLKEKRTMTWEGVTLDQILHKIGAKYNLSVKNSFPKRVYKHKSQTNQSDLDFMQRLAKESGATFAIKNNTILFRPKNGTDQEEELPAFTIDAKLTKGLYFETLDKTSYGSCVASWHSTKSNKMLSVTVGKGNPILKIKGNFKDESDAKMKALARLEEANRGNVRGGFGYEGMNIIAGAKVKLSNASNGWPSSFGIKQVRHSWGDGGYLCSVEIEN